MTPALAQVLPPPHPSRHRPDPARILTLSGTLALNLLVFGLLMVPIAPPAVAPAPEPRNPVIRSIPTPPEVVEVVPIQRPRPATPTVERRSVARPVRTTIAAPAFIGSTASQPVVDNASDTSDAGPPGPDIAPPAGPAPMQLAYRVAPAPVYPRGALQRQLTGTVLLRVLVDVDGRPLDVSIARSSGHRELDEAARLQILQRWSFQPATREGAPVQAIGLIPVEFDLRR